MIHISRTERNDTDFLYYNYNAICNNNNELLQPNKTTIDKQISDVEWEQIKQMVQFAEEQKYSATTTNTFGEPTQ